MLHIVWYIDNFCTASTWLTCATVMLYLPRNTERKYMSIWLLRQYKKDNSYYQWKNTVTRDNRQKTHHGSRQFPSGKSLIQYKFVSLKKIILCFRYPSTSRWGAWLQESKGLWGGSHRTMWKLTLYSDGQLWWILCVRVAAPGYLRYCILYR